MSDQLATMFIGTNDISFPFLTSILPALRTGSSAKAELAVAREEAVRAGSRATALVQGILNSEATQMIVLNLFDFAETPILGAFPDGELDVSIHAHLTSLVQAYNAALSQDLPQNRRVSIHSSMT